MKAAAGFTRVHNHPNIVEAVAHVNPGWRIGRLTRDVGEDGRIRFGLANG